MPLTPEVLEWIERFGGWVVVLVIVRWMMSRMDRQAGQVDALIVEFKKAIDVFRGLQMEEDRVHAKITSSLDDIEKNLEKLAGSLDRVCKSAGKAS